jgi:Family of unknown function (DUF5519)
MLTLPGVEQRPSRWGADPAFWAAGRELVHCHRGEVEVRVTRRRMAEALGEPGVVRRTLTSEWVQVPLGQTDVVMRLARLALEANRR